MSKGTRVLEALWYAIGLQDDRKTVSVIGPYSALDEADSEKQRFKIGGHVKCAVVKAIEGDGIETIREKALTYWK